MAGNLLAGFVKGFTGQTRKGIEAREEEEREERKARMLAQLRMDTEKEFALWKEGRPDYKLDLKRKEQEIDLAGRRDVRDEEKLALDRLNTESTIAHRDRSFGLDAARTGAAIRSYDRQGRSAGEADGILLAEANRAFDSLEAADVNPMQIAHAKRVFDARVNGIDPTTGEKIPPADKTWQRRYLADLRRRLLDEAQKSLDVLKD